MKASVLAIAAASLALPACQQTPTPIPVGANSTYYGNLEAGSKFGFSVGADRFEARRTLVNQSAFFAGSLPCNSTIRAILDCSDDQNFDLYNVNEFMKTGSILLRLDSDNVSSISWSFRLAKRPDF